MIIVFAVDYLSPETNGLVISTRRMVEALRAKGHTVRVLACGVKGKDAFPLKKRWLPIVSRVARKQKVTFAKYDETVARAALEGADVVHILMPFRFSYKLVALTKRLGIPTTAGFHVHPENIIKNAGLKHPPRFLTNLVFFTWRIHLYDKVSAIHCPSEYICGQLKKHHYRAKLCAFSNGVGSDFYPTHVKRDDDKFRILMIGRLASEKRQDLLVRAVGRSKYNDKIQITFAGDGPKRRVLLKQSQRYLCNLPNFKFFSTAELNEEINRSDLYVHAADVEVEGISCLEAISGGLVPLIARAKKSAAKQFILDRRCGFEAGSAKDLEKKIDYFVEHTDEKEKIQKKYLEHVRQFELSYTTIKMEEMLRYAAQKSIK